MSIYILKKSEILFDLTYSSNHIEGSRLTHDQTRYIFETNTIGLDTDSAINVDDIVETVNHFRCVDQVISNARRPLSEAMIKGLHCTLKAGSSDSRKPWFAVGGYKRMANEVGGQETTSPEDVPSAISKRLDTTFRRLFSSRVKLAPTFAKLISL